MIAFPDERVQQLLSDAVRRPPADRESFLSEACRDTPQIRRQIEELIEAHEQAREFLAPAAGEDSPIPADASRAGESGSSRPGSGDRVGRYRLVRLLGEGGFGSVFLAEQEHPIRRQVALKLIKPGMDSRQVVARFDAERQALAMMDHPNIARVFDAGQTDAGQPYVVMELVEGIPITEYCEVNHLTTANRIDLFISVCRAVQHAHQKGIIHRDIKPSNVLVITMENRAVPKVIDFGIAKAVAAPLTALTIVTEHRQLIGTPEYVSPEQADMGGTDIDTRSDIYSLGVLLYELLAGVTPFDRKQLRAASFFHIQRMILEVEPPRPSSRLSTLGDDLPQIARQRRIDPKGLRKLLRGDLDRVVMKCLEKDRAARYETAGALAEDLRRYLNNEVVSAAPPGRIYQFRKLLRRHRGLFAAAAAVAIALAGGMTASTILYLRAQSAWHDSEASAQAAREQAANAAAINRFLIDTLGFADPENHGRPDMPIRDILGLAKAKLDAGSLASQPRFEASVRTTLGGLQQVAGLFKEADEDLRIAYGIEQGLPDPDPREVTHTLETWADVKWNLSNHTGAEWAYRRAIDWATLAYGPRDARVGRLLIMLGRMEMYLADDAAADQILKQGLSILADASGPESLEYADTLRHLENFYLRQDRPADVQAVRAQRTAIYRKLLSAPQSARLSDHQIAAVRQELGFPFDNLQEQLLRRALERAISKHGELDPHVADAMDALAECVIYSSRDAALAEKLLKRALDLRRRLYGDNCPQVASSLTELATFLEWRGRYQEAVDASRSALKTVKNVYPRNSHEVVRERLRLALRLERAGNIARASQLVHQVIEANDSSPAEPEQFRLRTRLAAYLLWTQGDGAGAEKLCRKLLASGVDKDPAACPPTMMLLADALLLQGRPQEAEAVARRAVEGCTRGRDSGLIGRGVKIAVLETYARALYAADHSTAEIDAALRESAEVWDTAPEAFRQVAHDGTGFTAVDRAANTRVGQRTFVLLNLGRYDAARETARQTLADCALQQLPADSRQRHFTDLMFAVASAGSAPWSAGNEQAVLRAYGVARDDPHILPVYRIDMYNWVSALYRKWDQPQKLADWLAHAPPLPAAAPAAKATSPHPGSAT